MRETSPGQLPLPARANEMQPTLLTVQHRTTARFSVFDQIQNETEGAITRGREEKRWESTKEGEREKDKEREKERTRQEERTGERDRALLAEIQHHSSKLPNTNIRPLTSRVGIMKIGIEPLLQRLCHFFCVPLLDMLHKLLQVRLRDRERKRQHST